VGVNESPELYTIGQVARRIGVPARTIRFWCDAGILPPTDRSAGGYRQFDAAAVARLDLIRTLRELGLGLDDIRRLLHGGTTVAELARVHAAALDAQIRVLRLRRAVLRAVTARGSDIEEAKQMNDLARLSAEERRQIIDDFVDRTFAGVAPDTPAMSIAQRMRTMPAELPDDPTPTQVDAWIELASLVSDDEFQRRARAIVLAGASATATGGGATSGGPDYGAVTEHAGRALAEDVDPASPAGKQVLDQIVPPATPPAERERIADQLETFTDEQVERYWQLVGILNGRPPFTPTVPAYRWLITALRAEA
jgi:DNA-binding transcriptional MerR regulator